MNTSSAWPTTKPVAAPPKHEVEKPKADAPKHEPEKPKHEEKPEAPKQIEVSAEIAAAIFSAHTSSPGYATTTGSEHATAFHGGVKVEMPHDTKGRHTVSVKVPDTVTFDLME